MKTREIIKTVNFGPYRLDITQSQDSFNGLVYKENELIGCVAAGLHEGLTKVIEKAQSKIESAQ